MVHKKAPITVTSESFFFMKETYRETWSCDSIQYDTNCECRYIQPPQQPYEFAPDVRTTADYMYGQQWANNGVNIQRTFPGATGYVNMIEYACSMKTILRRR
jgi:hypothetical protein